MDYSDQLSINILPSLHRTDLFVILFALSEWSVCTYLHADFAYISDVVKGREEESRGLALATFGLGFTVAVGPLLGGHLANVEDNGKGQGGEVSVRCRDSCKHA